MDKRTNILISKLTEEQIQALSDAEIETIAMDRPGRAGHRGFLLDPQCYASQDHLARTMAALMHRLGSVGASISKGAGNV